MHRLLIRLQNYILFLIYASNCINSYSVYYCSMVTRRCRLMVRLCYYISLIDSPTDEIAYFLSSLVAIGLESVARIPFPVFYQRIA